jgi:radical SAM protein with 4Fe4S-binding SPASM domain
MGVLVMPRNYIYEQERFPVRAIISITERCNSKCTFCKVWEISNPVDLDVSLIDRLPGSLQDIDITGGEPLLHRSFAMIIEKFLTRGCRVIVVTNGLVNLAKFGDLWNTSNLGVRFSLDGIGDRHDAIRGVPGNFKKVLEQVEYLKSTKCENIGISSTFSDINIDDMGELYSLSRNLGVQLGIMVVGNSEIYYATSDNTIEDVQNLSYGIKKIICKELMTFNIKKWGRAIYMNELVEFINGKIQHLSCPAGRKFFFMKPDGSIYICNMKDILLGNLSEQSFEEIWFSESAEDGRRIAGDCQTPCWTMCNAKSIILDNKLRYFRRFCQKLPRLIIG